ncbi:MAG: ABC transporter permease [Verrucomicrobia bacterium]|nr:ABC transporter permease [Verrucomicrobiota bacterium]
MFRKFGEMILLGLETFRALPLCWRHRKKILEQFYVMGNESLLMACILAIFIGGVIALQSGPVMVERGIASTVGGLVGLSLCKELSPVMMSVLAAGRVGSAIAAEIGSMRVYQEIDALRTMSINPIHYLVLPRVVAMTVAVPMLVIFANLFGWVGGALVSMGNPDINIPWRAYFNSLNSLVDIRDILSGVLKSVVFAVLIAVVSCYMGLQTSGGPRGIGKSVTQAVVYSLVLILIFDYLATRILMIIL